MEYGEKLKLARLEKGMTQQQLADLLETTKATVSRWERGVHEPNMKDITEISEILEKPIVYFMSDSWVGEMRHVGGDKAYIPVIGEIACGSPILATQNVERYKEVLKDGLPEGELFYLVARGSSMEPRIFDGDDVLIRVQPDVEDGEIAAVQVENDTRATLKKVQHAGNSVVLTPLNPAYPTIVLNEENPGRIIGRAIRIEGNL